MEDAKETEKVDEIWKGQGRGGEGHFIHLAGYGLFSNIQKSKE